MHYRVLNCISGPPLPASATLSVPVVTLDIPNMCCRLKRAELPPVESHYNSTRFLALAFYACYYPNRVKYL